MEALGPPDCMRFASARRGKSYRRMRTVPRPDWSSAITVAITRLPFPPPDRVRIHGIGRGSPQQPPRSSMPLLPEPYSYDPPPRACIQDGLGGGAVKTDLVGIGNDHALVPGRCNRSKNDVIRTLDAVPAVIGRALPAVVDETPEVFRMKSPRAKARVSSPARLVRQFDAHAALRCMPVQST
jgi:hypothetical protein